MYKSFLLEGFFQLDDIFVFEGLEHFEFADCGAFNQFIIVCLFELLDGDILTVAFATGF
jgi:hypothetical protein